MMGIRPNSDGVIPPAQPDNPETRYSDWLTDFEDSGEIVGGVWKETDAKATSANQTVNELAGRVESLETAPVKEHTHVSADITDSVAYADGVETQRGRLVKTGFDGFLSSRQNPTSANHLARKGYVDESAQAVASRVDSLETAPVKPHTHVSADVTDSVVYADSTSAQRGRLIRTGSDGFLHSRDSPTLANHLARKGYVDQIVNDAPVKAHTHVSADITDSVAYADSTTSERGKLVRTGFDGFLYSRDNPTVDSHLARKGYVDSVVGASSDDLRGLLKHAIIAVPPANLNDLGAGQVYLDTATLTIHTK